MAYTSINLTELKFKAPSEWKDKLDLLAGVYSSRDKIDLTYEDLIREAIREKYRF